jgi:hypothetical protein
MEYEISFTPKLYYCVHLDVPKEYSTIDMNFRNKDILMLTKADAWGVGNRIEGDVLDDLFKVKVVMFLTIDNRNYIKILFDTKEKLTDVQFAAIELRCSNSSEWNHEDYPLTLECFGIPTSLELEFSEFKRSLNNSATREEYASTLRNMIVDWKEVTTPNLDKIIAYNKDL